MSRLDIYANPYAPERSHTPYVLDVQNDFLVTYGTRVVIPLRTLKGFGVPAKALNPVIEFEGKELVLDAAALAPVPATMLKKPVGRAERWRLELADALDTLFGSY